MAKKWEAPQILAVNALPKNLGDCTGGSSPGVTAQGECGCHNGESTVGGDPNYSAGICNASVPASYGHGCSSGGVPGTCYCGEDAGVPS